MINPIFVIFLTAVTIVGWAVYEFRKDGNKK